MVNNPSKNNLLLKHDENASTKIETFFYPSNSDPIVDAESIDEGSDDTGSSTLSVEELSAYLRALFNKERREREDGQKKFGICPYSEDPNNLLGKKSARSCNFGETIQLHPLLAHSQQFSGDDPSISANPVDNSEARDRFPEKRLENQLRLQKNLGLGASKTVTLAR